MANCTKGLRTVLDEAYSGHLECPNDREWNSGGKKSADNTGNVLGLHFDDI
jgi:hypothetical protein